MRCPGLVLAGLWFGSYFALVEGVICGALEVGALGRSRIAILWGWRFVGRTIIVATGYLWELTRISCKLGAGRYDVVLGRCTRLDPAPPSFSSKYSSGYIIGIMALMVCSCDSEG